MIRRISASAVVLNSTPRQLGESAPGIDLSKEQVACAADESDAEQFRQGYTDGFEAGKEDGLREAQLQIETFKDALTKQWEEQRVALDAQRDGLSKACAEIGQQIRERLSDLEQVAGEVALACLQHVLGEIHRDSGLIATFCASMVDEHRTKAISLRVGTDVGAALHGEIDGVEVVVDASVPRWSCRLETDNGVLEANFPDRLTAIQRSVMALLEQEAHPDVA